MTLGCPRCRRTLEFSGEPPRFCSNCGQSLGDVAAPALLETADFRSAEQASAHQSAPSGGLAVAAPDRVASYRLIRALGSGGMGTVYEAESVDDGRRVALKLISPGVAPSAVAVDRFIQEGRLASAINHPRCVFVLAADEEEGRPYIVMELMPGSTLQDLVDREGPLPVDRAASKILDVLDGLAEAHRLGLIHRDVKPSNCFLEADGRVKVGDFGLSKSLVDDSQLTRTGAFLGTPLYASPEQIKAEPLDVRTDVYSVAATLYFLLLGRAPFQGGDAASTLARIVSDDPPSPRSIRPDIPAELEEAILKGLERNRDRRWRDLDDFREAIRPFASGRLSMAGIGLRFAAYVVDVELIKFGAIFAINLVHGITTGRPYATGRNEWLALGFDLALLSINFFLIETLTGCSPGKKLLRLRVFDDARAGRPEPRRMLIRAAAFVMIIEAPTWAYRIFLHVHPLAYNLTLPIRFLGLLAILSTMRAGTGYRGVHEWISGTRTVRLPRRRARSLDADLLVAANRVEAELTQPAGMPATLGSFAILGAARWGEEYSILVGEDRSLGRDVWVDLRPAGEPPPSAARRDLSRPTRPRWVGGGTSGEYRWDAFLKPAGVPVEALCRNGRRLAWRDVRPRFDLLAGELEAACRDGTLPERLTTERLYIEPGGAIMFKDNSEAVLEGRAIHLDDQARSLRLLGEFAALALEGRPRPPGHPGGPVRAAIPGHARAIVDRLLGSGRPFEDLKEVHEALEATHENPAQLDVPSRLIRFTGGTFGVLLRVALGAAVAVFLVILATGRPLSGIATKKGPFQWDLNLSTLELAAGCILTWLAWAFATRGGVSGWLLRTSLVTRDGRSPSRTRCLVREACLWLPFFALLVASEAAETLPDSWAWLDSIPAWSALAWVFLDAVHEAYSPGRQLHDRLAGTTLVPR